MSPILHKYYVTRVVRIDASHEETLMAKEQHKTQAQRKAHTLDLTPNQKRDARLPYHIRDLNTLQGKLFEHYTHCKPRSFNRKKKLTSVQERMRQLISLTPLEKYKELAEHLPKLLVSHKPKPRLRYNINNLKACPYYDGRTKILYWYARPTYFNTAPLRHLKSYPSLLKLSKKLYHKPLNRQGKRKRMIVGSMHKTKKMMKLRRIKHCNIRKRKRRRRLLRRQMKNEYTGVVGTVGKSISTVKSWKVKKEELRKINQEIRIRELEEPIDYINMFHNVSKRYRAIMDPVNLAKRLPRVDLHKAIQHIIQEKRRERKRERFIPYSNEKDFLSDENVDTCVLKSKNAAYHQFKNKLKRKLNFLTPRRYIANFYNNAFEILKIKNISKKSFDRLEKRRNKFNYKQENMSRAQAESVIKNIIREIAQECAGKGQAVSETLVAFMVKAVVLDPDNKFNVDRTLTKVDVQKLIKLCVFRLLDVNSPSLDTIKLQVYFDMNYSSRADFLCEHRRVLNSRLAPVIREITDSRARTRDELESLYRKLVSAVLLRSGLGSPTDIAVVREATAALQSVFPQTELATFMSLSKGDKERQLQELTMIVTGIRLFNKECDKGGEGIDDLPAILNEAVPATSQNIDAEFQQVINMANKYTEVLQRLESSNKDYGLDVGILKESLVNCRQHESFLNIIMNDVIGSAKQVESLEQQLSSRLEQLQQTVQSKTAVPTGQVYPQFIHLSQLWSGFQDEMMLLSILSNILVSLEPFSRSHRSHFPDDVLTPHLLNKTEIIDRQLDDIKLEKLKVRLNQAKKIIKLFQLQQPNRVDMRTEKMRILTGNREMSSEEFYDHYKELENYMSIHAEDEGRLMMLIKDNNIKHIMASMRTIKTCFYFMVTTKNAPHKVTLGTHVNYYNSKITTSALRTFRVLTGYLLRLKNRNLSPNRVLYKRSFQLRRKISYLDKKNDKESTKIEPRKKPFKGYQWLFSENTQNFSKLKLKYRGFCPATLVDSQGLLIPGNPLIGILNYEEEFYSFSTTTAAKNFILNIDNYINGVVEYAKKMAELIQLLELHSQFASITPYSQDKNKGRKKSGRLIEKALTKNDSGTQTDTHFHDSNIVKSYEWNEWELRRRAMKLANIRGKITQSIQTNLSHHKRDQYTQCWQLKESDTQTKRDVYTNIQRPSVFISGLRGCGLGNPTESIKYDLTISHTQT